VAIPEKQRIPMIPQVVRTPRKDENARKRKGTKLSGSTLYPISSLLSAGIDRVRLSLWFTF
jgi:hypothetical protein